jgi:hypothetical protein
VGNADTAGSDGDGGCADVGGWAKNMSGGYMRRRP